MSRLAAYYQEDFQFSPVNNNPKQRKAAYIVFDVPVPKGSFSNSYVQDSERIRNLATSEPSLFPLPNSCDPRKMTLKHKPLVYGNQLIDCAHPSIEYYDNDHSQYVRQNMHVFDNESAYQDDRLYYDDSHIQRCGHSFQDKTAKRFSYVEPRNNNHLPEFYIPSNYEKHHAMRQHGQQFHNYDNRHRYIPEEFYYDPSPNSLSPRSPVHYHNGHWHIDPDRAFLNRGLLSPPSPLDSGLSSQSITSSPSLEADLFPSHFESATASRSCRDNVCMCRNEQYINQKCHRPNLSRHDSGRSSGIYSSYGHPKESLRVKNFTKQVPKIRDDSDYNSYQSNNIRYGKLGLVGETMNNFPEGNNSKTKREKSNRQERRQHDCIYESLESEKNIKLQHNSSTVAKSPQHLKQKKPFVIITEASDKSSESEDPMSPEIEISEKSDDIESSSSVTASSSKSSSVSSSDNDLNCNRKKSRTTEKEIRELEDMYNKCNLSDADLLDRAERRDLPTIHQIKRDQSNQRLKRSKSDTLYETITPLYRNPYETPQRAPPCRRSGLPDRVADDMALRKLRKATTSSSSNTKNTISYMLCNSHFTPTVPGYKDVLFMDYPDIEYDDLSYRKHYFGKKSKIKDPQPPFGIPLRPPPPQKVFSDYLHLTPSDAPQPLCHPRGNPDVVRDDLAFRALRKDEPERMYYDISQFYKSRKC